MGYLSLADFFLVGLALDISGAILLAKGLLLSPRELARLNTNWGVGYGQHQDRCRNRVAGRFGLSLLLIGFGLQAIGYLLAIAGVPSETGLSRLIAALILAGVATALTWTAWALLHERRVNLLIANVDAAYPAAAEEIDAASETSSASSSVS